MNQTRKKLIEELIRVGRLIDPAPGTGERKGEDTAELSGNLQQSDMTVRSPAAGLEDLPVVDDVIDQPYTTKDMFANPIGSHVSRSAKTFQRQQPTANKSGSSYEPVNEHVNPIAANPEQHLSQEVATIEFSVEELARELVTLIEDRVSQRSGEQLDDAFRDELTQAVIVKLEDWVG